MNSVHAVQRIQFGRIASTFGEALSTEGVTRSSLRDEIVLPM